MNPSPNLSSTSPLTLNKMDPTELIPSEELLARKWDRCVSNFLLKLGAASSVGIISSVTLFQKKTWPVALAAGFGLGLAYEQCQRSFEILPPQK